jgi:hypothetical protein
MPWSDALDAADHVAAILTAGVAVWAWGAYNFGRRQKRLRLETYLRDASLSAEPGRQGAHSLVHLIAELGMSEGDVMEAAFRSSKIERLRRSDPESGLATHVMLAYKRDPPKRF